MSKTEVPRGFSVTVPDLVKVRATQLKGELTWHVDVIDIERVKATSPVNLHNSIADAIRERGARTKLLVACCCCSCCCGKSKKIV